MNTSAGNIIPTLQPPNAGALSPFSYFFWNMLLITQFLYVICTHLYNSPVAVGFCHRTHCTCPGLISGLCRLDFECSPSTPETPAYTDTQDGLAGMVGL